MSKQLTLLRKPIRVNGYFKTPSSSYEHFINNGRKEVIHLPRNKNLLMKAEGIGRRWLRKKETVLPLQQRRSNRNLKLRHFSSHSAPIPPVHVQNRLLFDCTSTFHRSQNIWEDTDRSIIFLTMLRLFLYAGTMSACFSSLGNFQERIELLMSLSLWNWS